MSDADKDQQTGDRTAEEQQQMDHKRFESMYLQHVDILKGITSIHEELVAMRETHRQEKSFANVVSTLIIILIAAGFLSIATIIGYSR